MSVTLNRLNQDMARFLKHVFGEWLPTVPGAGREGAKLIIAGDMPKREDLLGQRPFCKHGQEISRMVAEIGLPDEDVYFTYIIKFPVQGKTPNFEETALSLPWFAKEVEAVKPLAVAVLGRAVQLLPHHRVGVRGEHGKCKRMELYDVAFNLFSLYHPAWIKNTEIKAYHEDLQAIARFITGASDEPKNKS